MSGRIIAQGTYRGKDGITRTFEVRFNGRRKSGLMEAIRRAVRNGGRTSCMDSAIVVEVKQSVDAAITARLAAAP